MSSPKLSDHNKDTVYHSLMIAYSSLGIASDHAPEGSNLKKLIDQAYKFVEDLLETVSK